MMNFILLDFNKVLHNPPNIKLISSFKPTKLDTTIIKMHKTDMLLNIVDTQKEKC